MIDLKRILVPTDFSETSEAALRYGTELARQYTGRLYLLHVVENPGEAAKADIPIGLFETMRTAALDRLGQLVTSHELRKFRPECAMRLGAAPNEIVRYAQDHEIDLIVMGTHGRRGIARVVLGSVAERVVRTAPCPVLTVHHPEHEFIADDEPIRTLATSPA